VPREFVAWSPRSVSAARRMVRDGLAVTGVDSSVVDDAMVVLSEMMTNALRHAVPLAAGQIVVSWSVRADGVEVAITDGGGVARPVAGRVEHASQSGRGLHIVSELVSDWGVDRQAAEQTVWAVLPTGRVAMEV
jgi:anti-sigma regulatory factor (Ser/Thr protein kinase)